MAKVQLAIDGKLGKDFRVTSRMGMRIHPVTKVKKHHNGTDIWSPHEPCWIEAPYAGTVLEAKKSTAAGGGFGNFVKIRHKIDGVWYTTLYAHLADGSLKVKAGQKITAGTPLGKMGSTGMSTGKHLHWELQKGKDHVWNGTGKNYIEPIDFFTALIAKEKAIASAPVEAKDTDPVTEVPLDHSTADADSAKVVVPAKPVEKIKNPGYPGSLIHPGAKGEAVKYMQQQLGQKITGTYDTATVTAVKALQKKGKLKVDGIVGPLTWRLLG
jgi:murein DD-endopeptidase MepM/ murein hydrolase activator NlpD